ncbi:MAG: DNA-binding protein [Clostridia bacterium]|nr:DNA-binding protein [Clostridia bacterium]
MERRVNTGLLMDFYGNLLTPHALNTLKMYLDEDMSLMEIAQEQGVSRQAVHELILRSEKQLNEYEEKLGLLERFRRMKSSLSLCESRLESAKQALSEAEDALKQIKED